jgi:hypothetical protein
MKARRIFHAPSGWVRIVPSGFSWVALVFGPLWAFANRAWLLGILLIAASIPLKFLEVLGGRAGVLVSLAFGIVVGHYGCRWLAWSLNKQGYREGDHAA